MSCSTLFKYHGKKVYHVKDFRNGHGSGPSIWELVSQVCTGQKFRIFDTDNFWPLYKSNKLSDSQRAVLLFTYDNNYVSRDNIKMFAKACIEVHQDILNKTDWKWSHWEDIGNSILEAKLTKYAKGFCLRCTSVTDAWDECPPESQVGEVYEIIKELENSSNR